MRPAWTPAEGSLLPRGTISKEGMEKALGQRYWERRVWGLAFLVSRLSLQHQTPALGRPTLEPSLGRANLQAQARAMALHDMQDLTSWRPEQHLMFSSPIASPLLPGDSIRQQLFRHGVSVHTSPPV